MRKVERIKPFGPKISFKALKIRILCILNAALVLTAYGCGPKKVDASSAPADDQKSVTQMVNNKKVEAISNDVNHDTNNNTNNTASATTTPEVTPVDASFITPEVSATPIQSNYFLFSPTEEELKALELESGEYYGRLRGNYNPKMKIGVGEYTEFDIVKNCCGDFSNLFLINSESTDFSKSKEKIIKDLHNFINSYIVTVNGSVELIYYNEFDGIFFQNPESYKIFEIGGLENYTGASTLKLVEEITSEIYESINKKNTDSLIKDTQKLLAITEMIFLTDGGVYKDTEITAFSKMYPIIKLFIREEIIAALLSADMIYGSISVQATDSSEYNLYQLTNMILDSGFTTLINNEIIALMDAYIEAVKNGKIVIAEINNDEAALIYSPSPTPNN